MFIHIGKRRIVSDKHIIGIFNVETLELSKINRYYTDQINTTDRLIVLDRKNKIISSNVSPFTVIKRTELSKDCIWRRENE